MALWFLRIKKAAKANMQLRPGEQLRCSNPECRLQVIVTDLGRGRETETTLRCSCGSPMKKLYEKPALDKTKLTHGMSATAGADNPR